MAHYKYISYDQIKCSDDSKGVGGWWFAEAPRYIFHYANVPYDEILINLENFTVYDSAWSHEFPILISDGQVLTNSMKISRHLAKQFGLNGKDDWEAAEINQFAEFHRDLFTILGTYMLPKIGLSQEADSFKSMFYENMDKYFPTYIKKLEESKSGFLSKSGVSWIDFMVANHMWAVRKVASETMKKKYPTLLSHAERVFALPGIKDFVEKDKKRYNMNEVIPEVFDLQEKREMNGSVVDDKVPEIVLAA